MNAKLVKRMRQHARRLMDGAPARGLVAASPIYRTLINDPKTVRGMYRNMKKGWANKEAR